MSLAGEEEAARAALRARQGAGARYDATSAPHNDLLLARRGTAYFARKLNELSDDALDAPSLVAGWSRRHVIAHVSYQARALARLVEGARTGVAQAMYESDKARDEEVDLGATLPARALRNLFHHSEVHLNVEWRDLPDAAWDASLRMMGDSRVAALDTPLIRARVVWFGAIDLDNGGRRDDLPPVLR